MEFLIHNISHSDLLVELSWLRDPDPSGQGPAPVVVPAGVPHALLARPKFSLFQPISTVIMDRVEEELRAMDDHPSGGPGPQAPTPSALADAVAAAVGTATAPIVDRPTDNNSPSTGGRRLPPSLLDIATGLEGPRSRREASNGHGRKDPDPSDPSGRPPKRVRWKAKCQDTQSPIGFKLHHCPIPVTDLEDFRLRGGLDTVELVQRHWDRIGITAVYFPLIALLVPKWLEVLREFKSDQSRQLIYLISGAGIPRNVAHCMQGNSTETTARLIALFVQQYYPHMEVIQVHSGSNIFRFDDNVQFMTRELRPRLEAHRETIVERSGEAWRSHFHVTIAYADGPPARLSALNASLRIFRPSYLHVWQLKTYWHERKLSMADVDFHSFENIEASPGVSIHDADSMTQFLVKEMRVFRDQFLQGEALGEVGGFWLRKSRKPVLAVLVIEKEDELGNKILTAHRGMNCEVSMPTGSLCAERNAIGSALAKDPTLRRRSLKMIGVLGLNLGGTAPANNGQANSAPTTPTTAFDAIPHVQTTQDAADASVASLVRPKDVQDPSATKGDAWAQAASTTPSSAPALSTTLLELPAAPLPVKKSPTPQGLPSKRELHSHNSNFASPRKPKRPRTFSCDEATVAVASAVAGGEDRNPLAPCGACKEWLLKIAEANPSFRVVTFENARCRSVYLNQIM